MSRYYSKPMGMIFLFLLFACAGELERGAPLGVTRVQLSPANPRGERVPAGDWIFFAVNAQEVTKRGRYAVPFSLRAQGGTWLIPNGNYYFSLVSFPGDATIPATTAGTPMTSNLSCVSATGDDGIYGHVSELNGGTKTIQFESSRSNCRLPPFGSGSALTAPLTVSLCNSTTDLSSATALKTCTDLSSGGHTTFPIKGVKAGFFSQDEFSEVTPVRPGLTTFVASQCAGYTRVAGVSAGESESLAFLPPGVSDAWSPFKLEILTYSGTGCRDSDELQMFTVNHGLAAVDGSSTASGAEPALTKTTALGTLDISTKARFVVTAGVPRLFIKDEEPLPFYVDPVRSEITLNTAGSSFPADGSTLAPIVVTLKDGKNKPVRNKAVTLHSSRGTADIISTVVSPTDESGIARVNVKSSTVGTARLSAVDASDALSLSASLEVTFYQSYKVIFVVDAPSGDLGGVAGADALCTAGPFPGVSKAILADGTTRRACSTAMCSGGISENLDWVLRPNTMYKALTTSSPITVGTTNSAAIFDVDLTNPIESSFHTAFTGLNNDWQSSTNNCSGWTIATGGPSGTSGSTSGTLINGSGTLSVLNNGMTTFCNTTTNKLYCAQQ